MTLQGKADDGCNITGDRGLADPFWHRKDCCKSSREYDRRESNEPVRQRENCCRSSREYDRGEPKEQLSG